MSKIIAVDFDGTLVEDAYPDIGEPLKWVTGDTLFNELIRLKSKGFKIILWTCRLGKELENAVNFCKSMGLEFDAINDDLDEIKEDYVSYKDWQITRYPECRKVYADIYIDDKAVSNNFGSELAFYFNTVSEGNNG